MRSLIFLFLTLLQLHANGFLTDAKSGETYGFDAKTLETSVNERLPTTIEYMYIFEIELQKTMIQLPKETDRIAMLIDTKVTMLVGTVKKQFDATVGMSSGIRYERSSDSVYLKDPNVENIVISGVEPGTSNYANDMINSALLTYYKRYPAYTLDTQEKEELDFAIKALSIDKGKVFVTLGERKAGPKRAQ